MTKTKACPKCKKRKNRSLFYSLIGRYGNISSWCKLCHRKHINKMNNNKRIKSVEYLGGKCYICGFGDWRALQIDHIKGGGSKENRTIGPGGIQDRVLQGKKGYQLLCANCNWIKRYEQKETR